MYAFVLAGVVLLAVGLAGVSFAPAIVAAQHRQRMTPIDVDSVDDVDRVRVTRATGLLFAVTGGGLLTYAVVL